VILQSKSASAPTVSGDAQEAAAVPLAADVADGGESARGRSDGDRPAKLTRSGQISPMFRTQTDPENVSTAKEQSDKIDQVGGRKLCSISRNLGVWIGSESLLCWQLGRKIDYS
jgi:hypothetical protein